MTCHNMSKRDKKKQTNQNIRKNKIIQTNQKENEPKGESKSEEKWYYFQNNSKKNNRLKNRKLQNRQKKNRMKKNNQTRQNRQNQSRSKKNNLGSQNRKKQNETKQKNNEEPDLLEIKIGEEEYETLDFYRQTWTDRHKAAFWDSYINDS